jgi:excisionase family DNA binding protein
MADENWLTVEEIAALLKVTEQTVRRWLRSGALVGRNFSGRTGYRVRETDLRNFLDRDRQGKAAA